MNDHEAANLLYSVCGYLDLDLETLKHRVLSGWTLRPPASLSENFPYQGTFTVEKELGEVHPRLLSKPEGIKL